MAPSQPPPALGLTVRPMRRLPVGMARVPCQSPAISWAQAPPVQATIAAAATAAPTLNVLDIIWDTARPPCSTPLSLC